MNPSRIRLALLAFAAIATLTTAGLSVAEAAQRHRRHHHPVASETARPAKWCGWFMARHFGVNGKLGRWLWLARNWANVGSPVHKPQVGAIVVWRHHVGKITAIEGKRIRVLSGNDGHAVRDRWRGTAGVIAYRVFEPPTFWAGL